MQRLLVPYERCGRVDVMRRRLAREAGQVLVLGDGGGALAALLGVGAERLFVLGVGEQPQGATQRLG
ncbi:MAG TPA: hypothetical protein VHV78_06240, partial [Gemmatimonadaceae bacterium]|nr:hypothetical protein [Gemmatimonadaceae bacterium]